MAAPYAHPPTIEAFLKAREEKTLPEIKADLERQLRPAHIVTPGHEVAPERIARRNKNGAWNAQSTAGKLITTLEETGTPYKVGESQYFTGDKLKPINVKVDGKQSPMTVGYEIEPGTVETHNWIDFPFQGRRGTLVGSVITWRNQNYTLKEFLNILGKDAQTNELFAYRESG